MFAVEVQFSKVDSIYSMSGYSPLELLSVLPRLRKILPIVLRNEVHRVVDPTRTVVDKFLQQFDLIVVKVHL